MKKQPTTTNESARMRSRYNFKLEANDMETTKGVSMTVPDETYTVQELLERHQMGLPVGGKVPVYDLEPDEEEGIDMNQFQQLELAEQAEILAQKGDTIEKAKKWSQKKKSEEEKRKNPEIKPETPVS